MGKLISLVGQKFGRWTALERAKDKNGLVRWKCCCDCGTIRDVRSIRLRNGLTKSCGCLQREMASIKNTKHSQSNSSIYYSWIDMKRRCNDPNNVGYKYYGARGIKVCDRWLNSFENFFTDMGKKPEKFTLERKDFDGNYEPSNCIWVSKKEQQRNKRNNRLINYNGKIQCMSKWAEEIGVSLPALWWRLKHYPPRIAFNM